MKVLVWLLLALNLYVGLRCLLNAVHILHTTKYSQLATSLFAMLFLGMGAAGLFISLTGKDPRLGLLVGAGPWLLGLLVLLVTMATSNYQ